MTPTSPSANYRKKLIEVALPLEAINAAAAKEKSIRHGHPSTLHLWWARRPLAACRAVLLGQFVDDPSSVPEEFPSEEAQEAERQRLFRIIEDMVPWANSNDETIFHRARVEIARSIWRDLNEETRASLDPAFTKGFGGEPARSAEQLTREQVIQFLQTHAPPVLDPFAGGGSIPLEAQRLGLRAIASDLNPVAVLINKALIEIPPKFAGQAPVNPTARRQTNLGKGGWKGAEGLANDVRYYGEWMREEAWKRIGHLYPQVDLPAEQGGGRATVIAWIWARTVKCPNPACGSALPLVKSFQLSSKKEEIWVCPQLSPGAAARFEITSTPGALKGSVNRQGATCIACAQPVKFDYLRSESRAGRMGAQLLAVVAEGSRSRIYVAPPPSHQAVAEKARPTFSPDGEIADNPGHMNVYRYGLTTWGSLFSPRQLVALTTFSDLVSEAIGRARTDAVACGLPDDDVPLESGGAGARAYGESVGLYLAFAVDKSADYWNTIATWAAPGGFIRNCFARQAIPMTWDYVEGNPFSSSTANWSGPLEWIAKVLEASPATVPARAIQQDARKAEAVGSLVSTDPPYYDNIPYADLSDFFYVWIRRTLGNVYSNLLPTLLVPKADELVASTYRFESREAAKTYFEAGFRRTFASLKVGSTEAQPMAVYYAFKQAESTLGEGVASTGWETMLSGLIETGYAITGTWPLRTERPGKITSTTSNMLASSIVLSCRKRFGGPTITRAQFIRQLREEIPLALQAMQSGNVAPVDFAQAAIGPGMAVYSQCDRVLEADGTPLSVRTALQIINQELDAFLASDDGGADRDTGFAVAWYEQHRYKKGPYGDAETLARAKNTAVQGVIDAGILRSSAGKAELIPIAELPDDWDPTTDERPTVWEATHHLIRQLDASGEEGAARLLAKLGATADAARSLAYRLYSICERKGWTEEARAYNALILSWPDIARLARGEAKRGGIEAWGTEESESEDE